MTKVILTPALQKSPFDTYYIVSSDKIVEMNMSDTYDMNGQEVGADDAGDHIEILSEKAVKLAANNHDEQIEIGDYVNAYDDWDLYNEIYANLKEDEDYILYAETVKGFNYWDGHNYRTVVVESGHNQETHTIVEHDEILKAIEEKEFSHEGFGSKIYKANGYIVEDNYFQGTWYMYRVYLESDYDLHTQNQY